MLALLCAASHAASSMSRNKWTACREFPNPDVSEGAKHSISPKGSHRQNKKARVRTAYRKIISHAMPRERTAQRCFGPVPPPAATLTHEKWTACRDFPNPARIGIASLLSKKGKFAPKLIVSVRTPRQCALEFPLLFSLTQSTHAGMKRKRQHT